MNTELLALYSSKWENLNNEIKCIIEDDKLKIKPTNPLLIYFNKENNGNNTVENWKDAEIRLMIFGQETNDWENESGKSICELQNTYNLFFNSSACFKKNRPFFNGVSRFKKLLQEKYPDKKIGLVWNNIVKIGKKKDKGFPPNYIYNIEREHFAVIKDEIEILKPNVVLFFTGPRYDNIIRSSLGKIEYKSLATFSERQVAKLSIGDISFAFRTYHPNYLWRHKIDNYLNAIINQIIF